MLKARIEREISRSNAFLHRTRLQLILHDKLKHDKKGEMWTAVHTVCAILSYKFTLLCSSVRRAEIPEI